MFLSYFDPEERILQKKRTENYANPDVDFCHRCKKGPGRTIMSKIWMSTRPKVEIEIKVEQKYPKVETASL